MNWGEAFRHVATTLRAQIWKCKSFQLQTGSKELMTSWSPDSVLVCYRVSGISIDFLPPPAPLSSFFLHQACITIHPGDMLNKGNESNHRNTLQTTGRRLQAPMCRPVALGEHTFLNLSAWSGPLPPSSLLTPVQASPTLQSILGFF